MQYEYVELKEPKHFRPSEDGKHGINKPTVSATKTNILHASEWDLQQSGATLIMRDKRTGATYHCPWADVKMALAPREIAPANAKAKAGAAAQ
jgi:hypothetical protein